MDDLLSSLCHARSQCQEQARESSLGLIAFDRLELAEGRFDHLAGTGNSLPRFQRLRLPSDEFREVVAQLCCTCTRRNWRNCFRRSFAAPRYRP